MNLSQFFNIILNPLIFTDILKNSNRKEGKIRGREEKGKEGEKEKKRKVCSHLPRVRKPAFFLPVKLQCK